MNPITKTIMESVNDVDNISICDCGVDRKVVKSHLLQSKLKLLEAVIEKMNKALKSTKGANKTVFFKQGSELIPVPKGNSYEDCLYNLGIVEVVSSLTQVKEELIQKNV